MLVGISDKKKVELEEMMRQLGLDPEGLTKGWMTLKIKEKILSDEARTWAARARAPEKVAAKAKGAPKRSKELTPSGSSSTQPPQQQDVLPIGNSAAYALIDAETATETVMFGKHKGKAYSDVMQQYPAYCNWVLETAEIEDEASICLQHFASWLEMMEFPRTRQTPELPMTGEEGSYNVV